VSLGNVLSASLSSKVVNFLRADNGDEDLFRGTPLIHTIIVSRASMDMAIPEQE
jgi:hypothetical protein